MDTWLPSVCPFDCPDTCGLLVRVQGGRATAVKGDPDHPFTQGFICQKMAQYPARVHHPQRLTAPLLRTGPKGSGQFKEISWDEALSLAARKLGETAEAHGPASVLPYSYAGHMGQVHRGSGHAFFHKLGATKLGRTICSATASAGYAFSLGSGPSTDLGQSRHSDLILIWGSNTLSTNLHAWPYFQEAKKRGARLVVIDPYVNETACKAHTHIKLRPGTDAALALGMMRVLISEDMLDRDFYPGLSPLVSPTWPSAPLNTHRSEWPGSPECPPSRSWSLAGPMARPRAPFVRTGMGPARQLRGGHGHAHHRPFCPPWWGPLSAPAGESSAPPGQAPAWTPPRLHAEELSPAGTPTLNMVELGAALSPQAARPINLLWVYLSNPSVVAPDTAAVLRGLAREDLFLVCQEMFMTETARLGRP